ncbi:8-amino-7-oxononanoate synthase [Flavobacterium sp. SE-s28]|uniref:8-amino-7-oxononanoate synthase n=2 Tax=Flavobacterium silvaticum TaxID=1852020 RepID=A0A972JH56_9FLAO|nr:8-amino-7-oxononanoate synthase [Flavobacterium silvaticum]
MQCFYIGFYADEKLIGGALAQYLNLEKLESFGDRDRCFKTMVRDFLFHSFSSRVLFIGNNMLTGQNAFFHDVSVDRKTIIASLLPAADAICKLLADRNQKIHLITFKDFGPNDTKHFEEAGFSNLYTFSTQPNMVLDIPENWKTMDDYVSALNKKYRDQYKRALKKAAGIVCRELNLPEIILFEDQLYDLYDHVARNAPFNTFFLAKNHFESLKKNLGEAFMLFGYFKEDALIGFKTIIRNGCVLDTYFLGYDDNVQKEHMLYLNMLYDMISFAISNTFTQIVFARTALEIKSSVGAVPKEVFGFMKHRNKFIDSLLPKIFPRLEPELIWQQRHPFK